MTPAQPTSPLNVLMINTFQTGGGAGRVGEALAAELRRRGHHTSAYVRGNPTGDPGCHLASHWRLDGFARRLRGVGLPELGHLTSLLWPCREEYAQADVLHLHNLHGEYLSLAALPLWGLHKPIVWTLHDFWVLTGNCATPRDCTRWHHACGHCPLVGVYPMTRVDRSRFYRRLKPRLFAATRPRIVTPSEWLGRHVQRIWQLAKLPRRVIRPPIDTDAFSPSCEPRRVYRRRIGLAPERPTVVLAGFSWADKFKGPDQAILALRQARDAVPDLQLLIVGERGDELLAAAGLGGRAIPFLNGRDALAGAYRAADVLLFPSRAENYPLTTLEAMACGTPVVAYDVGGIPEQIEHLQSGYVARDGHPEELAAGIVTILRAGAGGVALGAHGRAFVLRTSAVSVVTEQYEDEYRRALAAWQRRRGRTIARWQPGSLSRRLARALGWDTPPCRRRLDARTLTVPADVRPVAKDVPVMESAR